jgi:hypothetical protein
MTSKANQWEAVHQLVIGDHVHLHELVEKPPSPGSRDWLPILQQLVAHLMGHGGHWGITLCIGEAQGIPADTALTVDNVFEYVDASDTYEPPAVYRLSERAILNRWEGEQHKWSRMLEPAVMEHVGFNRPKDERPERGGWFAQITFEIRPKANA